jgi:hypothetical protein
MGKQRGKRSRRGGGGSTKVTAFSTTCNINVCRFSGSFLMNPTLVSGANTLGINPNTLGGLFSPVLTNLCNIFTEYRFTKLRFRIWPQATNNVALAYTPEILTPFPTSLAQALQSPYSILIANSSASMVPLDFNLNRSVLMSAAAKWWKVVPTAAADDWDENQGSLFFTAGTATPTLIVECYYSIELTGLVNASTQGFASTPVPRRSLISSDYRAIDLVVPGKPFVVGKTVDEEWARVKKLAEEQDAPARREASRLLAL